MRGFELALVARFSVYLQLINQLIWLSDLIGHVALDRSAEAEVHTPAQQQMVP